MKNNIQKLLSLPPDFKKVLFSQTFGKQSVKFWEKNALDYEEQKKVQEVIDQVLFGELDIDSFEKKVKKIISIKDKKNFILDLSITFLYFLDEFIKQDVEKKLIEMGANLEEIKVKKDKFLSEVNLELNPPKPKEPELVEEEEVRPELTPEQEQQEIKEIFSEQFLTTLNLEDQSKKIVVNTRIIDNLFEDEDLQPELLRELINNNEILTKEKIVIEDKKVDPTVSAWILDFVLTVGTVDVDNVAIGKYFNQSENVKNLSAEEKTLVRKVIDIYRVVKEFPDPYEKVPVEEWYVFPIDYQLLKKQEDEKLQEKGVEVKQVSEEEKDTVQTPAEQEIKAEADIMSLYKGDPVFAENVDKEIKIVTEKTRNEYNKVADLLEDYLLKRDKIGVVASLKVLADIGVLNEFLSMDKRFSNMLSSYYRRVNRPNESQNLMMASKTPHHLTNFLKYLLIVRLQLAEQEAARIATQLANILARQGLTQYADMAYFDMKDKQFHWKN